jgi:hypothetical protein
MFHTEFVFVCNFSGLTSNTVGELSVPFILSISYCSDLRYNSFTRRPQLQTYIKL